MNWNLLKPTQKEKSKLYNQNIRVKMNEKQTCTNSTQQHLKQHTVVRSGKKPKDNSMKQFVQQHTVL